jgi:hypothetical protein
MVALLVLCGCAHTPNEFGNQVRELLLAARRQPLKDRLGNWGNSALVVGWVTLPALHGFPPWLA